MSAAAPRVSRTDTATIAGNIERDAALVGVVGGEDRARCALGLALATDERRLPSHRVAPRWFDLDDVCTQIGQELRAVGADRPTQVEQPAPVKGARTAAPPAGDDDQLAQRHIQVDLLQIILPHPAQADAAGRRGRLFPTPNHNPNLNPNPVPKGQKKLARRNIFTQHPSVRLA